MSHEITRILRAFASTPWFIEPRKAEQIVALLEFRAANGPRAERVYPERAQADLASQVPMAAQANLAADGAADGGAVGSSSVGTIRVLRIHGAILPRTAQLDDISGPGAVSLEAFQKNFREAAADPNCKAIILDVDSPGGQVDLVPETVAMIHAAKRADRPIIAVANTMAASAAYWLASAADEFAVTPSGTVGSIGVYMLHEDISTRLKTEGISPTFIYEGPRKVEGNPFEPLSGEARAALQASVRTYYEMFTKDVAKARGVPVSVVRADPEATDKHFGGGRSYQAREAVKLGMADRVATLDETIRRAAGKRARNASVERKRLALI